MNRSGNTESKLIPLIVGGVLVLAGVLAMLLLFVFAGIVDVPLSLVFLTVLVGFVLLGASIAAALRSRRTRNPNP